MSDNLHLRGPQDRAQINVNEPWELSRWAQKFGVTPAQLIVLVRQHGTFVSHIEAATGRKVSRA